MAEYIINISEEISDNGCQEILNEKPLVRCKDCWRRDSFDCHLHEGGYPYHDTADDWFCADGERRTE